MTDSFEAEMLDFCVRFLTKRGENLSAEQLSTLSVLFSKQVSTHLNPFDPTSFTFQWTPVVYPSLSEENEPLEQAYTSATSVIVDVPLSPSAPSKRRCPYGYDGAWASPIPVQVVKQLIKEKSRLTLHSVIEKYAKNGETRLTHEIAINFLADRKGLTPEEFLRTVAVPSRYAVGREEGYSLSDW
jgi:hypothetical protein